MSGPNTTRCLLRACLAAAAGAVATHPAWGQSFADVASQQGLGFQVNSDLYGNGVSFFDVDGDGLDDLTFAISNDSLEFHRNTGGNLQRLPSFVMGHGETKHVLWCDHDNDGDHDLLVTTFQGRVRLFRNEGGWTFTDITEQCGLLPFTAKHFGASFGDYDRDGWLDLYVCTYEGEGNPAMYDRLNHLYRNNGDGTFTDVTLAAGVGDGIRLSFQSVWADFDLDGWPDLFVINDREFDNSLYRNNGDGTFTDIAAQAGLVFTLQEPMTATVGDFDNDGDPDIFMTNTGTLPFKHCNLMVNDGTGHFTDQSTALGVDVLAWSWGAVWADLENDGLQDLFFTTGMPNNAPLNNYFFRSQWPAPFVHLQAMLNEQPGLSHGCAKGDLNSDGYADIAVQGRNPTPPQLWLNSGGDHHHVRVSLQGTASNRMGVGATIHVHANGQRYTQYLLCGENFVGQDSQHKLFGLGQAMVVDSIVVHWPSGHRDRRSGLPVNASYLIVEGESYSAAITPLGPVETCADQPVVLDAGEHAAYLWNNGHTGRFLTATASAAHWATVWNAYGVWTTTDTVQVVVHPLPDVLPTVLQPACAGDSTGSIALENLAGTGVASVLWSSGATGSSIGGLAAGEYSYLLVDTNGCEASGAVLLTEPPPLWVQVETLPVQQGGDGSILIAVFGGTPPYSVLLNGEPAGTTIGGLGAGTYTVMVTDAQGCTVETEALVEGHTHVAGMAAVPLVVIPNPVRDVLRVRSHVVIVHAELYDAEGRPVGTAHLRPGGSINVEHLAPGAYWMRLLTQAGTVATARFVRMP